MNDTLYPNRSEAKADVVSQKGSASFHGLGPHAYLRSNERIEEAVNESLANDPYIDASDIHVTVRDNRVLLEGHVQEDYAKQHAQRIVMLVRGVREVENKLHVLNEEEIIPISGQAEHPTIISEANAASRGDLE